MTFKRTMKSLMIALLGMGLVACDDDSDNDQPTAQVRVVHASPDAPAVDVLLNDNVVLEDVEYQGVSGYLNVPTGVRTSNTFKVNVANTSTTVIEQAAELETNSQYTILAVNNVSAIEPLVLLDDTSAPARGNLKVRVLHASPSAGSVDIYVTAPSDALNSPTLSNVPFKTASDYLEVPAGDYRVRVTATGSSSVVYDSGTVALPSGAIYTLAAVNATKGTSPISLLGLTGESSAPSFLLLDTNARVRAIHLSYDAPNVDIYANGGLAFGNVAFRAASSYATLGSGDVTVDITIAGDVNPYRTLNTTLSPSEDYTVLALNTAANLEALPVVDDNSAPAAGNTKFRVVHASPEAPAVDILINDNVLLSGVEFRGVSGYTEAPAGTYNVKVQAAGGGATVIDVDVPLNAGTIYTVIAANELASIEPLLIQDN